MKLGSIAEYEELNLAIYVDGEESKMVFGNTKNTETSSDTVKEQVSTLVESMKNPYFNIYHWVKGEIFDIESVERAVQKKDGVQNQIQSFEKRKKNTQESLDNVTTGKKTVKTLFKNMDDTGKMVNKIENVSNLAIVSDPICID